MNANRTFSILLFSSILILIGLITLSAKITPLLLPHAVYVCQETFSNVLFSISHSIPLLLITLVIMVLLLGFISLWIQALKTKTYLKKHLGKKISTPSDTVAIIEELGLKDRVDIVKDKSKLSFCYGLFKPRICLSTSLLRALNIDELKAVLLHESYHIRNHDPLKIILSQTASLMFFFIPILKEIQHHYALTKEIAADEAVIKSGKRESLISVLSKLLVGDSLKFSGVAALANLGNLEKRVLYLTGNQKKTMFKPSLLNILLSAFVVLFSLAIVNTPVYAVKVDDSCEAKEEVSYSKDVIHTPANYTRK